jgi:para-nitrobenzyl esterase
LLAMPPAQGLFHKAVMESGPTIRIGTEDGSRELTDRIMKRLGVSSASINKLEDIPYDQLEHAASAEMAGPRAAGPRNPFRDMGRGLSLGPVMDGKVVAQNPFDPDAPPSANNIPLLIGTTLNEFTNGINHPDAFDLTDTQLQAQVENSFPGHGAELIASYRELYPNANPFQLWSIISTASVRDASLEVARIKSKQSASVYCYQFAWQTPVLDGRPMAFHCSELPFVFDNAALCEHMTGGGEASHALAERVSRSWINFAKHGDPSHGGIPRWNRFTTSAKTTMVFDDHCRAVDNLDTKQLDLVRRSYART